MNLVAIIPHYRHLETLPTVIQALREFHLPIMVIDDGSGEMYADDLQNICTDVQLFRLPENGGKGAAMKHGLFQAAAQGFTHALQIDADAQHTFSDVPKLLAAAQAAPDAVICGRPIYGDDAPKSRLYGRRMDFDNEILVQLYWHGTKLIWIDTPVVYENHSISHFRAWQDNVLISKMHARLFFQMLARLCR